MKPIPGTWEMVEGKTWKARLYNKITTMKCPECGKEVEVRMFGNGYVACCCGKIIYNSDKRPEVEDEGDD